MQCPSCGTRNNYYHHYCYFCGNALPVSSKSVPSDESSPTQAFPKDLDEDDTLPLKRHTKTQERKFSFNFVKFILFLIFLSVIIFGTYRLVLFLYDTFLTQPETAEQVSATAIVESTIYEGRPAQRILVHTNIGEVVEVLGRSYPVSNGQAEIILENAFLHSRFPAAESQNGLAISLEITVYKGGIASYKETLSFTMEMSVAPLTLIQPQQAQATVFGNTFRIVFTVSEGSTVFINGDNFTDLLDDSGRFQKDVDVPDVSDVSYEIRVLKRGFKDNVVNVVLRREVQIIPLTLDQPLPIRADSDSVVIRGTTHPEAQISTDLETIGELSVNSESGIFTIEAVSERPGLSAGVIRSVLSEEEYAQIEIVIFRTISEADYTRRAWAPVFADLLADPLLHNGQIFLFRGTVEEVILFGEKNIFTVNVSGDPSAPQLILVEYWGNFEFSSGDSIRVFGNRWGNHNGKVRVLAPFIYP